MKSAWYTLIWGAAVCVKTPILANIIYEKYRYLLNIAFTVRYLVNTDSLLSIYMRYLANIDSRSTDVWCAASNKNKFLIVIYVR